MDKDIADVIERIYKQKDTAFYLEKCRENFELPLQAAYVFKKYKYAYKKYKPPFWPSTEFFINFGEFQKDSFKVQYKGELIFSKLVKVYTLDFFYEIDNPDPDFYSPNYYDGCDEPLTVTQANFQDELISVLMKLGYKRLYGNHRQEIIPWLEYTSPNDYFHGQIDVWTALSHDVLDLTEDD